MASVVLGTAYGIWKEYQLDNEVWRVVDQHLARAEPAAAPVAD